MKRHLSILLVILLAGCVSAQKPSVKWQTITEAAQGTQTKKLYLIDFYTSWCGWCKKMDSETYQDPTVAKLLAKYYIPVKFDAESSQEFTWNGTLYKGITPQRGRKSPHQFAYAVLGQKQGYPSTAILKADRTLMTVLPGYFAPNDMVQVLWYFASGDCDRYSWPQYQKIFDKEIRPVMLKAINNKQ